VLPKAISFRQLRPSEASKIAEIDRSEYITRSYFVRDGRLCSKSVSWAVPRWTVDGEREFNVATRVAALRGDLESGDVGVGAFDGELLVGYIVLHTGLTHRAAQLKALFVSRSYRRRGIARRLTDELSERARAAGADQLYVSSVPSESAVSFYRSQGFRLADEVHPDLYELEPDDIHMTKDL
jgi:ribosomal protein S18 acetylase RimI-like enzyme